MGTKVPGYPFKGNMGDAGAQGIPGKDGLPGKDGVNGINGVNGVNGKDGTNGQRGSVWTTGTGTPSSAALSGDMYLDNATGDVWQFS